MKRTRTITARLVVDLRRELEDCQDPIAFGIGCDGTVLAAGRASTENLYVDRGLGRFPKSHLDAATSYQVLAWRDGHLRQLRLVEESLVISYAQPIESGVLLVGARCRWTPESVEKNAVIYDWDAREVRRLTLGDGIQDVRTTPDGTIWTSYFDEGTCGNYGWNHPGPTPIGAPGLVAFDQRGVVRWAYDAEKAHTDSICDAYALNVATTDDVWIYFYTEFPIVHVVGGGYQVWPVKQGGASALVVQGQRALLFGDYKERDRTRIVEMSPNGRSKVVEEVSLVDANGRGFEVARTYGVGPTLFLIRDRVVYEVDSW
jgi:hypothetical protein